MGTTHSQIEAFDSIMGKINIVLRFLLLKFSDDCDVKTEFRFMNLDDSDPSHGSPDIEFISLQSLSSATPRSNGCLCGDAMNFVHLTVCDSLDNTGFNFPSDNLTANWDARREIAYTAPFLGVIKRKILKHLQ
ncbi:hypothetical protein TNCV_4112271 [Trichonephila clavipes]|nr:hypothetical protein TNCV_4112271 [Trichonephila clavipes]